MSLPAGELARPQPGAAEAVGQRGGRQRGDRAERGQPELLERLDDRRRLLAAPQQGDGLAGQGVRPRDDLRAARARPRRPGHGAEARGAGPDPRGACAARRAPPPPRRRASRRAAGAGRGRRSRPAPGRVDSTPAPVDSSRVTTPSQASATPTGSGGTSASRGHRASASPRRIPGWIPKTSAEAETSPTSCSRPGSGARAAGPAARISRPPAATASAKRGSRTQTIDDTNACSHPGRRRASAPPVTARTRRSRVRRRLRRRPEHLAQARREAEVAHEVHAARQQRAARVELAGGEAGHVGERELEVSAGAFARPGRAPAPGRRRPGRSSGARARPRPSARRRSRPRSPARARARTRARARRTAAAGPAGPHGALEAPVVGGADPGPRGATGAGARRNDPGPCAQRAGGHARSVRRRGSTRGGAAPPRGGARPVAGR